MKKMLLVVLLLALTACAMGRVTGKPIAAHGDSDGIYTITIDRGGCEQTLYVTQAVYNAVKELVGQDRDVQLWRDNGSSVMAGGVQQPIYNRWEIK